MENSKGFYEFWDFVKECEKTYPQITLPTIEILWERKKNDPIEETNQDEKTTSKKSKK
jgi:hypothetical protein